MVWKFLTGLVQVLLALVTFLQREAYRQEGSREVMYDLEKKKVDALEKARDIDSGDVPRDKQHVLDRM